MINEITCWTIFSRLKLIIGLILVVIFFSRLFYNLSQGYVIVPPFKLDTPLILETFHSNIRDIAIAYPQGWTTHDFVRGNHGDYEVISYISAKYFDYPSITIAYRTMPDPSLEKVAVWGKTRILAKADEISEVREITVNDRLGLSRTFNYTGHFPVINSAQKINCRHIYLLNNEDAYVVEMCVDEQNDTVQLRSVFDKMIQSVSIN